MPARRRRPPLREFRFCWLKDSPTQRIHPDLEAGLLKDRENTFVTVHGDQVVGHIVLSASSKPKTRWASNLELHADFRAPNVAKRMIVEAAKAQFERDVNVNSIEFNPLNFDDLRIPRERGKGMSLAEVKATLRRLRQNRHAALIRFYESLGAIHVFGSTFRFERQPFYVQHISK